MASQLTEKISEFISKVNEKNPYYLIGGFLVVLLLVDYFCVLQFQIGALNSMSPQIATLSHEIQTANNNIQKSPQYRSDLSGLKDKLNTVNLKIRTKEEAPLILENISRIANKNGLRIEKIIPQTAQSEPILKNEDGQYFSIPIDVEAKSSYHDFARFVNQLETEEIFLVIPEFSILKSSDDTMHHSIQLLINAIVFEKS